MQRLLLSACIESPAPALSHWHQWTEQSNFDLEDSASLELASLAVSRFERDLKDCTELQRCRGWRRREWLVSELAQDALRRIEHQCRKRSLTAIAIGDIATARTAVTFAERPFALRSLDLVVSGASMDDRIALLQAARTGPAADAFESKSLKLSISSRKLWRGDIALSTQDDLDRSNCPHSCIAVPSIPEQIALLANSNWQRRKYGTLRWILEIISLIDAFDDKVQLARILATISNRDVTTASLQSALNCIASLPETNAVEPLVAVMNSARKSPFSVLRRWRKTTRLEPSWSLLKIFIKRQLQRSEFFRSNEI